MNWSHALKVPSSNTSEKLVIIKLSIIQTDVILFKKANWKDVNEEADNDLTQLAIFQILFSDTKKNHILYMPDIQYYSNDMSNLA